MSVALSEENMANSPTVNLFAATVALACSTVAAPAADYDVGSIHITQPWSRATPKAQQRALAT
jgi:copper(I)-binding protein